MKNCKQCNAPLEEGANFCSQCAAPVAEPEEELCPVEQEQESVCQEVTETEAAETEAAETEAPAEEPKKKGVSKGLIIGLVAAVLVLVAVILVKGNADGKKEETAAPAETVTEQAPAAESTEMPAEPAKAPGEPVAMTSGLHTNAYGLASYSVHPEIAEDGTVSYCYMNENGELVYATEESINALLDTVVATCGDRTLTNRELQYYYEQQFYSFYTMYSNYLAYMMDTTIGLDEQTDIDGVDTWQKRFLEGSLEMFLQVSALCQQGEAEGFALTPEAQEELEANTDMTAMAASYGYDDAAAFIWDYIGPFATPESYVKYVTENVYANAYYQHLAESMEFTDAEVEAYYDEHADDMVGTYGVEKIDQYMTNVRHILITPETAEDGTVSDEAWAAAEAEARKIYDKWLADGATEDRFAEMAGEYTEDPGSMSTGGLYEDIYPGQMVTEFNDWCFDPARQVGDHGIVKTSYGYHLMFFSGWAEEIYWRMVAESELINERATEMRLELVENFETASGLEQVVIMDSMAPTAPAAAE